jgi:hypothetical protein
LFSLLVLDQQLQEELLMKTEDVRRARDQVRRDSGDTLLLLETCKKLSCDTSKMPKSFLFFTISANSLFITLNFVLFIFVLSTAERGRGHAAPSGTAGTELLSNAWKPVFKLHHF